MTSLTSDCGQSMATKMMLGTGGYGSQPTDYENNYGLSPNNGDLDWGGKFLSEGKTSDSFFYDDGFKGLFQFSTPNIFQENDPYSQMGLNSGYTGSTGLTMSDMFFSSSPASLSSPYQGSMFQGLLGSMPDPAYANSFYERPVTGYQLSDTPLVAQTLNGGC